METTLLLLKREDEILLAMKKRGFGAEKYNGIGGKIEENETPETAMIRETQEEILITPIEYEKVGRIQFIEYYKQEKVDMTFHLFLATKWKGDPQETEEMKPEWFSIKQIPYDNMFEDDRYWLPYILKGKKVKGFFEYDEAWNLLSYQITEW